ncbi:outer membrane receptor for ferrienterochelin and colicins [Marinobacter segnicrescens]|uniref:Outer membrane receptor for ferrienterochelin and colicins n=1 Tax=Marinobacter segnicrescens TaxID=430453 RepID=A0A1I0DK93_9GAMM|nr:TonB-dependent receptor [Marinobacter segnicrescens]SET32767.1 outer membrane receptor for ferrienterochelin and colicins [Marinobacter segnicrescens]
MFTRPSLLASAVAFATSGISLQATAQPIELDELVVSASGFEQKVTDAPASISVITQEQLSSRAFSNIAEALDGVEGVDIRQGTGKTGGLNISIRGLPSEYTLILVDGRRQNTGGNVTPNGFGETATSFIPPLSAIERIEVIRGPMSTLYGSDAMGGVINIITRNVADEWTGSVTVQQTLQEDREFGNDTTTEFFTTGPLVEGMLGLQVRGRVYDRGESDLRFEDGSIVNRRGAAPVEGRTYSIGSRLTLAPTSNHDLYLDFERGRQVYNNDDCQLGNLDGYEGGSNTAGCLDVDPDKINGYDDELRFYRDQVALGHTGRFQLGTLTSTLTHNKTETLGRTIPGTRGDAYAAPFDYMVAGDERTLESRDLVLDSKFVTPLGESHIVTVGGQYWDAEVTDGIAGEDFERTSWAVFLEDEWSLTDDLYLTLGARHEKYDGFDGQVSPRAYLVWNPLSQWTFKGGVSRGFRAPSVNDLHDGISSVSGQGSTIAFGNPDLEPEITTNTELGAYYDNLDGFKANVTVFHNRFKDKIDSGTPIPNCFAEDDPGLPGCISYGPGFTQEDFTQQINIGKAETRGIELGSSWQFAPEWSVSGNYTFTDSEQKSGENKGAPLTNTPEHLVNAAINWQATPALDLWFKGEYRSKRERFTDKYENLSPANKLIDDQVGDLKGYSVFHLGGSYQAAENITLNAAIYNLFDKDFTEGERYLNGNGEEAFVSSYIQSGRSIDGTIEDGRRLWLSATVGF